MVTARRKSASAIRAARTKLINLQRSVRALDRIAKTAGLGAAGLG
jgi:hypothetical protein